MGFTKGNLVPAIVAGLVMMVMGFFFAAVSGYLVGLIGSSNNPISGLTISVLVIAAILMVLLGAKGTTGVIVVLAVAGVICVSSAVAGEMLQDLKVGHILMWVPLFILNAGDLKMAAEKGYQGGFGGDVLAAPQAGLMAKLSLGIVGGEMVWPLLIVGLIMAIGFILVKVKSPMLVCVGMYLSFGTVAAIFVGGIIRWVVDMIIEKRKFNDNQKSRIEKGLLFAALAFFEVHIPNLWPGSPYFISIFVIVALGYLLVKLPLNNAGNADQE
jgi:putative OPT family oligopeptide transporter